MEGSKHSRIGSLVRASSLFESVNDVGELLLRSDGRDLGEAGGNELRGKVDNGRAELSKDEFGELNVEFGDLNEPRLKERNGDGNVELAFVFCVKEPCRNLLCDLGRDRTKSIEEEDVGVTSESARTTVHELNDLLRASEDSLISSSGSSCDERDLLNDTSNFRFLRNTGESGSGFVGDSLLEFADESLYSRTTVSVSSS